MMKIKAFTLTELMLALVIIGVISALVVPIIYNSYSEKVLITKLKKTTSQILTATKSIMADEHAGAVQSVKDIPGNDLHTGFYYTSAGAKTSSSTQGVQYFLEKYFKYSKTNCGQGGTKKCVGTKYMSQTRKNLGTMPSDYYCISTPSAAAICMARVGDVIQVIVDINGQDSPNMTGVDTFSMYIANDGDLKDLDPNAENCNKDKATVDVPSYAAGCFAKVLESGWKVVDSAGTGD